MCLFNYKKMSKNRQASPISCPGNSYRYWDQSLGKRARRQSWTPPKTPEQLEKRSGTDSWLAPQSQGVFHKLTQRVQIKIHFAQITSGFTFSNLLKWVGFFSNLWTDKRSHWNSNSGLYDFNQSPSSDGLFETEQCWGFTLYCHSEDSKLPINF